MYFEARFANTFYIYIYSFKNIFAIKSLTRGSYIYILYFWDKRVVIQAANSQISMLLK